MAQNLGNAERINFINVDLSIIITYFIIRSCLILTTLLANSADNKVFFQGNRIWHSMQIISIWDNLYEMSYPVFWEK